MSALMSAAQNLRTGAPQTHSIEGQKPSLIGQQRVLFRNPLEIDSGSLPSQQQFNQPRLMAV